MYLKDLLKKLQSLSDGELEQEAYIYNWGEDEYIPVKGVGGNRKGLKKLPDAEPGDIYLY
jgi:hypothetical protein